MSYASYLPTSYQDVETKIAINGVELVNRHELSSTQDRELQRFIDNNSHILEWKDREIPTPKPVRHTPSHHYDDMRRSLSRGPSPFENSYNSLDKLATRREKKVEEYPSINPNDLPICPNIENHNYTNEFPGLEYLSDNHFIEDLIKQGHVSVGSAGLISQPGSRVGSAMGGSFIHSNNSTFNRPSSRQTASPNVFNQPPQHQNYYTTSEHTTTTTIPSYNTQSSNYGGSQSQYAGNQSQYGGSQSQYAGTQSQYGGSQSQYGSLSNFGSNYGTLKGGMKHHHSTLPPTSPYSSLKRKGVSWLDQERARSLSPGLHQTTITRNVQHQYNRPASTIHTTSYTTTY